MATYGRSYISIAIVGLTECSDVRQEGQSLFKSTDGDTADRTDAGSAQLQGVFFPPSRLWRRSGGSCLGQSDKAEIREHLG